MDVFGKQSRGRRAREHILAACSLVKCFARWLGYVFSKPPINKGKLFGNKSADCNN